MRKSAMLTMLGLLMGGCTFISPPPREAPPPEPPLAEIEPPPLAEPVLQQTAAVAARPAPRRPSAVRIDNTSIESFRSSWERMRSSLSPAQQADLSDAVARLTFADYGGASNVPANLRNSPIVPEMVRHQIAGLTFAEIIALAP